MANHKLIYSNSFKNNIIGDTDQFIENIIISNLPSDAVFINTTWLELSDDLTVLFDKNKIAICYSGPDWENTNCIDVRKNTHILIKENFKEVTYIGNTKGKFYFNFWAEFIRQHHRNFLNTEYIAKPNFKKLFMCLNRKPHQHRLFLTNLLEKCNLLKHGYVSIFRENNSLILKENFSEEIILGQNSVVDNIPIKNDIVSLGDIGNWNSHFLNIVTETTIHTDVFISEKTWKPIIGQRPFLILGDYNIYNQLKEIGIDTFDDLFGVWYNDTNWEHRAKSIVNIVDNYKNENLEKLYFKIEHRLAKNRNKFIEYMNNNIEKINNESFLKSV